MMRRFAIPCDPARVAETIARIRVVAEGGIPDRVPLLFYSVTPPVKDPPWPKCDPFDDEQELEYWIALRTRQLERFPEGDFYPWVWAGHAFSQAIVPSLFGARIAVTEPLRLANVAAPLIRNLETDLERLPERVDTEGAGMAARLRRRLQAWVAATGGRVAIMPFDWQSPYGVACQLMSNEDLMLAMYDTPRLVHRLFERVTRAIEDLIEAARRWIGDPSLCLLNNQMFYTGITLHDDYISVLSPTLHAEFCQPYNMRLYRRYGAGHLHTCGPVFPGYLEALLGHPGLLSMDISPYLRGQTRTRDDLLELKRRCRAARVTLTHHPTTCDHVGHAPVVPADRDLFNRMAEGGGLILNWGGGTREDGLRLLEWGTACYR